MGMKNRFSDLTGRRFGRFTAQWPSGRSGSRTRWLCLCDCGEIRSAIPTDHLTKGNSRSCGCLQREHARRIGSAKKLPNNQAAFNVMFTRYKVFAERRNLSFSLSKELFFSLVKSHCYYCGTSPKRMRQNSTQFCVCNGVDRKDNSIGYEEGNVVPCCKTCNFMKMQLSHDDFIKACYAVAVRMRDILEIIHS